MGKSRIWEGMQMKSYLDLVSVSAKILKRQNRRSVICIVLSVYLVTGIFGMADMFVRSQIRQAKREYGTWHIAVKGISDEEAAMISARPDVANSSRYGVLNYRGDQNYSLNGKNLIICGSEESFAEKLLVDFIREGNFPKGKMEALITENARSRLGVRTGDQVAVLLPDGSERFYTISGFAGDASKTMSEDSYGLFLTTEGFRSLYADTKSSRLEDYNSVLYVQFAGRINLPSAIADVKTQFGLSDSQVSENVKLLGLSGQSRNSFMMQIYGAAAVLSVLVMVSGILMIASSLNSNVAQRTEFFGMIRCIGATPKQIMRLVQKEAFNWCKFAIPAGVMMGIITIWILCAVLRVLAPVYLGEIPVFGVSAPSILAGAGIGLLSVFAASRAPAKRASRVSPLAAVLGAANDLRPVRVAANTGYLKIETSLGIHHAKENRKNFILMTGSFSLSIILFLAFSVTIDFGKNAAAPLRPWTSDLSIMSQDQTRSVNSDLIEKLRNHPAVKRVYGRTFVYDVPSVINGKEKKVDLISYEQNQFGWSKKYLLEGSIEEAQEDPMTGLVVFEQQNTIRTGDVVRLDIGGRTADLKITGMLSVSPFDNAPDVGIIICSEDTIRKLLGQSGYTIIDIQMKDRNSDKAAEEIRRLSGEKYTFSDKRSGNSSAVGTFLAFSLFIYGFLAFIAVIAIFHIINSIAMSTAARMKQYGVLRAIGLTGRQLEKMIAAEAFTHAFTGCVCGCVLGVPLNKYLFSKLVTFQWNEPWTFPLTELIVIVFLTLLSALLAVRGPMKRIRNMPITDLTASL